MAGRGNIRKTGADQADLAVGNDGLQHAEVYGSVQDIKGVQGKSVDDLF